MQAFFYNFLNFLFRDLRSGLFRGIIAVKTRNNAVHFAYVNALFTGIALRVVYFRVETGDRNRPRRTFFLA